MDNKSFILDIIHFLLTIFLGTVVVPALIVLVAVSIFFWKEESMVRVSERLYTIPELELSIYSFETMTLATQTPLESTLFIVTDTTHFLSSPLNYGSGYSCDVSKPHIDDTFFVTRDEEHILFFEGGVLPSENCLRITLLGFPCHALKYHFDDIYEIIDPQKANSFLIKKRLYRRGAIKKMEPFTIHNPDSLINHPLKQPAK